MSIPHDIPDSEQLFDEFPAPVFTLLALNFKKTGE